MIVSTEKATSKGRMKGEESSLQGTWCPAALVLVLLVCTYHRRYTGSLAFFYSLQPSILCLP